MKGVVCHVGKTEHRRNLIKEVLFKVLTSDNVCRENIVFIMNDI